MVTSLSHRSSPHSRPREYFCFRTLTASFTNSSADVDRSVTGGSGVPDVTITQTQGQQSNPSNNGGNPSPTPTDQPQQQPTSGAGQPADSTTTTVVGVPGEASRTTLSITDNGVSLSFPSTGAVETTPSSAIGMLVTSDGRVFMTTASTFASTSTYTSGNKVYTVTVNVHNPTGALNKGGSSGSSSSFFNNKGAVAGVFVVVGLAVVAIIAALATIFFRRRRRQRLDREVTAAAVAASAAAARHPLDEEGDMSHPPSDSYPSTMSPSTMSHPTMAQYSQYPSTFGNAGGYDPFTTTAAAGAAGAAAGAAGAGAYGAYHDQQPYSDNAPYTDAPYEDAQPYSDPQPYSDRGYSEQLGYGAYAAPQSPDFSQPAGDHPYSDDHAGGYEGLHQGGEGYYYDPGYDVAAASQGDVFETPPSDHIPPPAVGSNPFQDYSGGEGSIDTPMERPDPLHVANPSSPHGDNRL